MNVIDALDAATADFEDIAKESGWLDGWGRNPLEKKKRNQPFFYRNSTDTAVTENKVNIDKQSEILYMIYTDTGVDALYVADRAAIYDCNLTLNVYHSNSALFSTGTALENQYRKFLSDLVDNLTDGEWIVTDDSEEGTASDDAGDVYLNRKTIFIHKIFSD